MDKAGMIPINEFCTVHHLEISFVRSLEEHGLVETVVVDQTQYFSADELPKLEQMVRLHQELNINFEGIDAINNLLDRMQQLQQEITGLKNKLRFFEEEV